MDRVKRWKEANRDSERAHTKAYRDRQRNRRAAVAMAARTQETTAR